MDCSHSHPEEQRQIYGDALSSHTGRRHPGSSGAAAQRQKQHTKKNSLWLAAAMHSTRRLAPYT
eukprot:scaffold4487_cov103-Isochrysis_galbana.AAC.2